MIAPARSLNPIDIPMTPVEDLPVLIVDDNETNRQVLERTTSNWAMRPQSVLSGAEALASALGAGTTREAGRPEPSTTPFGVMPVESPVCRDSRRTQRGRSD